MRAHAMLCLGLWLVLAALLASCRMGGETSEVVVYTSVDQPYSEPILTAFEEQTGIRVRAVYDVEASKTTGLVNRLLAEASHPQADVFWNSEVIQTIVLEENQALSPYVSPEAEAIPPQFRDPDGHWTGLAGRARVLLVNTDRVPEPTRIASLNDLLDPTWPGESIGIAYPLFGTTATHAAALYAERGQDEARAFFEQLQERGVRVVDGNSVVRDLVASGQLAIGLTDTDDACAALAQGAPVQVILPDQDGGGTLIIPSTVALVAGGPHPEQGRALIDYLLRPETEQALVLSGYCHVPLHAAVEAPSGCIPGDVRGMAVDYRQVEGFLGQVLSEMREVYLR